MLGLVVAEIVIDLSISCLLASSADYSDIARQTIDAKNDGALTLG
jgi:hypothetical protein